MTVSTAPGPSAVSDPRSALRAMIRSFERTRDVLAAPGRRLLVLRSAEPMLVLGDNSVALRRKDGTFGQGLTRRIAAKANACAAAWCQDAAYRPPSTP
ncbi:hypothetical protein AB0O39_31010 [Streptomyces anulatus]|uniref:hypothetical protein n=1 Tax=Streptomyces anulatus TaxID=1892 RepID=UPI00343A845B